jgi:uncharacterized membrane protein
MAFCAKCGSELGEGVAVCPKCGAQQGAAAPAGGAAAGTGIQENVAGLLCYVMGWVTGLVFFLIDKRPFVRFHAAQSIVIFGGITVLYWVLSILFSFGGLAGWAILSLVFTVIWLGSVVLWILCMVKAYQGQRFEVPIAADFAKKLAG